ncbi:MAG: transposase [Spirochaetaceae bacterium]|nr:transposase [Spirochaetaceae bacterium]
MEKIIAQHVQFDKQAGEERGLTGAAYSYVYDKEYQQKHLERIEKKLTYIDHFLETAEAREGAAGGEVKSNITDKESAKIKGAHGYIQGYHGIAVADSKNQVIMAVEAFGSGSESEHFPGMLDSLNENMKTLTGNDRPLEEAIVEGDTGYVTEKNLKEAKERNREVIIPDQQFRKRDEHFDGRPETGARDGIR